MSPLRKDAARNRDRIIAAAREISTSGGALALNSVAKAAEVGVATVYRHFATVDELEEALVWAKFDDIAISLEQAREQARPDGVEHVLTVFFTLMVEDELFEKVAGRTSPALEHTTELRTTLTDELADLMGRAKQQGRLRTDLDAAGAVLLVCGIAHAARAAGATADSPTAQGLLRVMLDGITRSDRPPRAPHDHDLAHHDGGR